MGGLGPIVGLPLRSSGKDAGYQAGSTEGPQDDLILQTLFLHGLIFPAQGKLLCGKGEDKNATDLATSFLQV